jgi:hypothetical protein
MLSDGLPRSFIQGLCDLLCIAVQTNLTSQRQLHLFSRSMRFLWKRKIRIPQKVGRVFNVVFHNLDPSDIHPRFLLRFWIEVFSLWKYLPESPVVAILRKALVLSDHSLRLFETRLAPILASVQLWHDIPVLCNVNNNLTRQFAFEKTGNVDRRPDSGLLETVAMVWGPDSAANDGWQQVNCDFQKMQRSSSAACILKANSFVGFNI